MKNNRSKVVLLILLVIGLFSNSCQNKENDFTKNCILLEPQSKTIGCGVLSVWVGMKFQVIDNNVEFVGLIQCPEVYDTTFFIRGQEYKVLLTTNLPDSTKNLIINDYKKESIPLYQVVEINKKIASE